MATTPRYWKWVQGRGRISRAETAKKIGTTAFCFSAVTVRCYETEQYSFRGCSFDV